MIENILEQIITVAVGLGILGGSYLVWLLSGIANVIFTTGRKWSWKRMFEDLAKVILMCVAVLSWVAVINALEWFANAMGSDISAVLDGASVAGLVGGIIGGTVYYISKGYKNFYNFFNTSHTEVSVTNPDYKKISDDVKKVLAGAYVRHDRGNKKVVDATLKTPQMGSWCYYWVDTSTPESFYEAVIGKGFDEGYGMQCVAGFKEFMYALSGKVVATWNGKASGYAQQQDQIEPLGFEWHGGSTGLQDGDWGIFGDGEWGHVAMYYRGQWLGQNQNSANPYSGSPFSLASISLNGLIGYYRPVKYKKSAPALMPIQNEVDYTYKEGDTFGQVILNLGLGTSHGLWGEDGDVAYYDQQLHDQGIYGNIPIGTTIHLIRRP